MRKLRLFEIKLLVHGYTVIKWWRWDSNSDSFIHSFSNYLVSTYPVAATGKAEKAPTLMQLISAWGETKKHKPTSK